MSVGKRIKKLKQQFDTTKSYPVASAIQNAIKSATAKFDESIDVAVRLGVDPKQGDQQVRGSVNLPHGLGKTVRVLVFAKGPKEAEAKAAGADYVGGEELVQKILGGWLDFDKAIATPDMIPLVSKAAKVLGPRGLMPNSKLGTVTTHVADAVSAEKKGKLDFRIEKGGIVHVMIGKKSMGFDKLHDNFWTFMTALSRAKPQTSKGTYIRGVTISPTMGLGFSADLGEIVSRNL
jgi:large subunit ribosomal protein L1